MIEIVFYIAKKCLYCELAERDLSRLVISNGLDIKVKKVILRDSPEDLPSVDEVETLAEEGFQYDEMLVLESVRGLPGVPAILYGDKLLVGEDCVKFFKAILATEKKLYP